MLLKEQNKTKGFTEILILKKDMGERRMFHDQMLYGQKREHV